MDPQDLQNHAELYSALNWEELDPDTRNHWYKQLTGINLPPLVSESSKLKLSLDDFEPSDLATAVSRDPLLAGQVLAVANCAIMGLSSRITSIERAVVHLGFNLVQSIIVCYHLVSILRQWPKYPRSHFDYVRRWSAGASSVAYNIARDVGFPDAGMIGTATLLARLGSLLLGFGSPAPNNQYYHMPNEIARLKLEADTYGITSTVLSEQLVRHWGLPEPLPTLLNRQWEPLFTTVSKGQDNRNVLLITSAIALASAYMTSDKTTAQLLFDRQAYQALKENLQQYKLYETILSSWHKSHLQRELAVATD